MVIKYINYSIKLIHIHRFVIITYSPNIFKSIRVLGAFLFRSSRSSKILISRWSNPNFLKNLLVLTIHRKTRLIQTFHVIIGFLLWLDELVLCFIIITSLPLYHWVDCIRLLRILLVALFSKNFIWLLCLRYLLLSIWSFNKTLLCRGHNYFTIRSNWSCCLKWCSCYTISTFRISSHFICRISIPTNILKSYIFIVKVLNETLNFLIRIHIVVQISGSNYSKLSLFDCLWLICHIFTKTMK